MLKNLKRNDVKEDATVASEYFELLVSDEYELVGRIPVHVHRYNDGTTLLVSNELNMFAQGDSEYLARKEFSDVLIEELEDLEETGTSGLGKALQIRLSMLKRLLKKAD